MRKVLSRKRHFLSLVLDEVLYRAVCAISSRGSRREGAISPLCGLTSDLITQRLISTGSFESSQIEALDAILEDELAPLERTAPGQGVFLDIGANIGIFTTRYAKFFSHTIAVEANPITFHLLLANIGLRQLKDVSPVNVGASDREGTAPLHVNTEGNLGWSSLHESNRELSRDSLKLEIDLNTIDSLVGELQPDVPVSLIKIDVEGHELQVLKGALGVLETHKPVILYEENGTEGETCANLLKSIGYSRFAIFKRAVPFWKPFSKCDVILTPIDPDETTKAALICAY